MSNLPAVIEPNTPMIPAHSALDQNPALVYLASLTSFHSRRTMQTALNSIADVLYPDGDRTDRQRFMYVPWHTLHFQHTAAIRSVLADHHKAAGSNKILAALRGVLKAAYNLGYILPDDYRKATDIKPVKGETLPSGRDLAMGEILALVQACSRDKRVNGARDVAMIGVLYACGLRRAELVALDLADYDPTDGRIAVRSGKGNKDRTAYATNATKTALDGWLAFRGAADGPLFWVIGRGAHNKHFGKRLTTQSVYDMLRLRAKQAGVKDFSPHDFRRTFVGDLLDRGVDIVTVQHMAGHASPTTTARYDRRGEETKRQAASTLHFPFTATSRTAQTPLPATPEPAKRPIRTGRSKSKTAGLPVEQRQLLELFTFEDETGGALEWERRGPRYKQDKAMLESLLQAGYVREVTHDRRTITYAITDAGRDCQI